MSLWVLDTDILVLDREEHDVVCANVLSRDSADLATTVITVEEQLSGWYTLLRQSKNKPQVANAYRRLAESIRLLSRFQILSYTEDAIDRFDQLKAPKLGVRHMDLRIAGDNGGTRRHAGDAQHT